MYIFWDVSDLYQTHYPQNTHPPSLFSLGFPEISDPTRICNWTEPITITAFNGKFPEFKI